MTGDGVHSVPVRSSGRNRARQVHLFDQSSADRGPVRTCVGCRTRAKADDLLRVVVMDGTLVPDVRRRLPGRGAWLHPVPECLTRAERRSAFLRALRVPGPLDVDRVRSHLKQLHTKNAHDPGPGISPMPSEDESQVDPS